MVVCGVYNWSGKEGGNKDAGQSARTTLSSTAAGRLPFIEGRLSIRAGRLAPGWDRISIYCRPFFVDLRKPPHKLGCSNPCDTIRISSDTTKRRSTDCCMQYSVQMPIYIVGSTYTFVLAFNAPSKACTSIVSPKSRWFTGRACECRPTLISYPRNYPAGTSAPWGHPLMLGHPDPGKVYIRTNDKDVREK